MEIVDAFDEDGGTEVIEGVGGDILELIVRGFALLIAPVGAGDNEDAAEL